MKNKVVKFAAVCAAAITLCGCVGKEPQIIARTQYQDVARPDESDPSTAGAVAAYHEEVERLLLLCAGKEPQ